MLVTKDIPDEESGETAELSEIAEIGALNLRILQKLWAFRFSARAGAAARFMTSSPVLCPLAMFAPALHPRCVSPGAQAHSQDRD